MRDLIVSGQGIINLIINALISK